jgi:DNA-directed RNA polymerase subunit RPC12/RpoP
VALARALASLTDLVESVVVGPPPRCPRCGARACDVEEHELIAVPPILRVVYRCPRCGEAAGGRTVGVPGE